MDNKQKLLAALRMRCQSLIQDGYTIIFNVDTKKLYYIKLHHRNGNTISLLASSDDCRIVQRTNGIVVHDEKVC